MFIDLVENHAGVFPWTFSEDTQHASDLVRSFSSRRGSRFASWFKAMQQNQLEIVKGKFGESLA